MSTPPEPAASERHFDSVNQTEPQTSNAVITPITPQETKSTENYLARRLHFVLHDLGLREHLPSDWLRPGPEGLSFASLSLREADKLVLAVEDLACGYKARRPSVSPDQLPLF